jgi:hypothetical protein
VEGELLQEPQDRQFQHRPQGRGFAVSTTLIYRLDISAHCYTRTPRERNFANRTERDSASIAPLHGSVHSN